MIAKVLALLPPQARWAACPRPRCPSAAARATPSKQAPVATAAAATQHLSVTCRHAAAAAGQLTTQFLAATITGAISNPGYGWYTSELPKYDFNNQGFSPATGHLTQVLWKGSKQLGCGVQGCQAANGFRWYTISCRYAPPGNVAGQYYANVQAAGGPGGTVLRQHAGCRWAPGGAGRLHMFTRMCTYLWTRVGRTCVHVPACV